MSLDHRGEPAGPGGPENAGRLRPGRRLDLTDCEREPTHVPAGIQLYGVLLPARAADRVVVQLTGCDAELFGAEALGVPPAGLRHPRRRARTGRPGWAGPAVRGLSRLAPSCGRSRTRSAALLGSTCLVVAACGGPHPGPVRLPTYAPTSVAGAAPSAAEAGGLLPADCDQLLSTDQLPALLGLPIGSIGVEHVRGLPSPSVGLLERLTCTYRTADPSLAYSGRLLRIDTGAYTDRTAARAQRDRNIAERAAGLGAPVPLPMGAAAAAWVPVPDASTLLISYDRFTLDIALQRAAVGDRADAMAVDLVRRLLPRLVSPGTPPPF